MSLPGTTPNSGNASDYVAEMSLDRDSLEVDVGYQWNSETDSTARAETRFEYRPAERPVVRLRLPLSGAGSSSRATCRWYGRSPDKWRIIGRYSYSFLEQQPLEQFVGLGVRSVLLAFRVSRPALREPPHRRAGQLDHAPARAQGPVARVRERAGRRSCSTVVFWVIEASPSQTDQQRRYEQPS